MSLYPWVLSLHIVSMVAWMAGMLYLPRLFVYHIWAERGSQMDDTFQQMESRLLKIIMTPAMVATWVFGFALLYLYDFNQLAGGYMQAKLGLVLVMSGLHGFFAGAVRKFAKGQNRISQKAWRWWNEAPTLLLIAIVILVIVKPF